MIEFRDVAKRYGAQPVLDGLDFEARPGEVTLLVGANGCGKSTTLRVATGLSPADRGTVRLAGHVLGRGRAALDGMAYLPQAPRFHPRLTVAQVLRFYARLRDVPDGRRAMVARDWQLDAVRDVPCGRLSGGLRQRLALAVLLLPDAPLLLLDEPGLSLDPDWRRALQHALHAAAGDGRTVLVATHLLGEWEDEVDRCLVLEGGRIGRTLAPDRLREAFPFARPARARAGAAG
ncbi:MAG: ABC transporter ATP-binding protein [Vicinamibacterales bacterium]